jgi:hypothetical protein
MPILDFYKGIRFVNLGTVVLIAVMLLEILIKKGRFEYNREFLIFMALLVALNIIDGFMLMDRIDITTTMNNTASVVVFTAVGAYFIRSSVVEKERFFRFLCAVALISTLFIFVQYVMYLRGTVVYGLIPGLQLENPITGITSEVSISYGRPTSFFREPAHYAIYILPIYTMTLFRRRFALSIVFLAGLLVSTSSTALFIALVVTAIFIAQEKRIPIIIKWILAIIGVVLLIQFIPTINESGVIEKLKFVNLTTNIRVFGTLQYFKYFGAQELFFGVGLNQISSYMKAFTTEQVANYANAIFFSFFSFGLVGGGLWTYYMVRLFRLSRFKMVFLVFLMVCLSDQILFNRNLMYLMMLLYIFSDGNGKAARGDPATPASPDSPATLAPPSGEERP